MSETTVGLRLREQCPSVPPLSSLLDGRFQEQVTSWEMTDGTIKLGLRRVQYEDPEGDEESLSDSKHHCVDSEIRLSGEDGEIYGIDCA